MRWNRFGWTFVIQHRTHVDGSRLSFGAGLFPSSTTAGVAERPYYTETGRVIIPVNVWLIAAVTDLGISILLIAHLNKMKTGFKRKRPCPKSFASPSRLPASFRSSSGLCVPFFLFRLLEQYSNDTRSFRARAFGMNLTVTVLEGWVIRTRVRRNSLLIVGLPSRG
ncbi:hypothetical protein FB45DRAFT_56232 [Roridomyces roridus]|uniref:Uncharacterized protein n=1 Tax=Roridomyces roridus TaxID=1738132 RepID=A0AAD7FLH5_9AGAR|nr:hypothetical protein FB45DRAFT_56232 [Roridomyces roridus]